MTTKKKTKKPAILLALIPVIGGIIIAYIEGCFSTKAANSNPAIQQNNDTGIFNNAPINKQTTQSNNSNATQFNSERDIIINQPLPSSPSPKKTEGEQRTETKSQAKEPPITIQENKGFVNIGGKDNIYNQTIQNGPKQRDLNDKEVQEVLTFLQKKVPRSFYIQVGSTLDNDETKNLAGAIEKRVAAMGFKISQYYMMSQYIYDSKSKRVSLERLNDSTILINILPQSLQQSSQ